MRFIDLIKTRAVSRRGKIRFIKRVMFKNFIHGHWITLTDEYVNIKY